MTKFLHAELVDSLFKGFNCSMLCCGAGLAEKQGLAWPCIGQICDALLLKDRKRRLSKGWLSYIEISACEIRSEAIYDLMVPSGGGQKANLRVREHPDEGPFVDGLSKTLVQNRAHVKEIVASIQSTATKGPERKGHQIIFVDLAQVCMSECMHE
jgi:hypothetical protein